MPFILASITADVLLTEDNTYTVWQQLQTAALMLLVLAITYTV